MRSPSCTEAILLAFFFVGVACEDEVFLKPPLLRRQLTTVKEKKSFSSSGDKASGSSSSSTSRSPDDSSSRTKSSPSSSRTKPSSSSSENKSSSSSPSKKSHPSSESSKSDHVSSQSKNKPSSDPSSSKSKPTSDSGKGTTKDVKNFSYESESCGEDTNGGCNSDPPVYGNIEFDHTLIGEFGAIFDPDSEFFQRDTDWFLFSIHKPGCVQATVASIYQGSVALFEGSTFETKTCLDNLINVASGDSFGDPASYCFHEAGTYGVFVAPEFTEDNPCEGQPFTYFLSLEHVECGTCLVKRGTPGCSDEQCKNKVCEHEKSCCNDSWGAVCVKKAREMCDCTHGDNIIDENEKCGEDTNNGCNSDRPVFGSIDFGQVIIGEYGGLWDSGEEIYELDRDWFLFSIKDPGTCVRATLNSIDDGIVILFEGLTTEDDACEDIVDVASGNSDGRPAVYCFVEPGTYGAFVAPAFENNSPCEGDPHKYILALEHLDKCGTCLLENYSPGCVNKECESTVCELDESCCEDVWDATCVEQAKLWCECAGGEAPDIIDEDEPCGEDINGGCFQDPPSYGNMELGQTLIGEYGAVWNTSQEFYRLDTDWFLFDIEEPGTCVEAILISRESGEVVLFEAPTFSYLTCENNLVNVASGESNGDPAIYCFPKAGEYGVFVAPKYEQESPCEGDPNTYVLTLNGLECGTCFIDHDVPGCSDKKCEDKVCDNDNSCCSDMWDATCVEKAKLWCGDCNDDDKSGSTSSDSKTNSSGSPSRSSYGGKEKGSSARSTSSRSNPSSSSSGKTKHLVL